MTLDFAALRRTMVEGQLRTYDVSNARLIAAIEAVPREDFVPESRKAVAYIDQPVALAGERIMLTPMVFARLVQMLEIEPGEHVLDLACGTGYSSAVLAGIGANVTAVDDAVFAADMKKIQSSSLRFVAGSVAAGAPDHGPFNAILVNGAVEVEPEGLFGQLADGGRLAVVIGAGRAGRATLFRKSGTHVSGAPVFDASAPLLGAFRKPAGFVF